MHGSFESFAELAATATQVAQVAQKGADFYDRQIGSLTQYTKPFNIMSRLYIEQNIANDDIALPIIGMLNQLYCSYVISALNLNNFVVGGRTVRDLLKLVSTEAYVDVLAASENLFGKEDQPIMSMEASVVNLDPDSQRLVSGRVIELDIQIPTSKVTDTIETDGAGNVKKVEKKNERGNLTSAKLTIYVQLIPYIVASDTIGGFINLNFSPTLALRWKQYKAGEIKFWKDFILARDLIAKEAAAVKSDKSGVLYDMLNKSSNALFKWMLNMTGVAGERHNIANSILVCDKRTFQTAAAGSGLDFRQTGQRQAFFRKTMMMIVVLVDTMYNNVEMYFNGIDVKGEYSYPMINKLSKGKDAFDLKDIMTAFSQGMTPKF